MDDKTIASPIQDLTRETEDEDHCGLLIQLRGEDGEPITTKFNVYADVYVCPVCGSDLNYNCFCECGWYNPNMPATISC